MKLLCSLFLLMLAVACSGNDGTSRSNPQENQQTEERIDYIFTILVETKVDMDFRGKSLGDVIDTMNKKLLHAHPDVDFRIYFNPKDLTKEEAHSFLNRPLHVESDLVDISIVQICDYTTKWIWKFGGSYRVTHSGVEFLPTKNTAQLLKDYPWPKKN